MKISALIENTVATGGLVAEHGLSLLIETDGRLILFDTGQGSNFIANAKRLGYDLTRVESVVVSHGHFDHAGGLEHFCRLNPTARIYAKESFLKLKYKGEDRFIGIPPNPELFHARITSIREKTEIAPGFFLLPDIPLKNVRQALLFGFTVREGGKSIPDDFSDELFLAVVSSGKLSVISGCSHRGITNILAAARSHFAEPLDLVLGGFHLSHESDASALDILKTLKTFKPRRIGVCHCTGVEKYPLVRKVFGQSAYYHATGMSVEI